MQATLETAGERVRLDVQIGWVATLVGEAAGAELEPGGSPDATLEVVVERSHRAFVVDGEKLGRNVRRQRLDIAVDNVAGSGFDMLARLGEIPPTFVFRRRTGNEARLMQASSPRFRLRQSAAITQFPALWRATTVARAPLHAACFELAHGTALVVGAPGAGKSTALAAEARAGRRPVTDNLCVADPVSVWPVVEPFRGAPGSLPGVREARRRTTHGRVSSALPDRLASCDPDLVVVLRRGPATRIRGIGEGVAARLMVTATYAAGELRRFWPLAATLALASEIGPAMPPVLPIARALTTRLPCVEVTLGRPGLLISDALRQIDGPKRTDSVGVAG